MTDNFEVAIPAAHRLRKAKSLSLRDIATLPLISVPPESAYWVSIRRAFADIGQEFCPVFQTRNALTTIAMVRAGLGAALITPLVRGRLNMDGVLTLPIRDTPLTRRIGIVTAAGRLVSPAADAMISQLRDSVSIPE